MSRIAVIGGGISGLACAFYLSKFGASTIHKISLIESSNHLGGWIHSRKTKDGAIHELGPRSLRGSGKVSAASLELVEELGLTDDIIPVMANHKSARNRFVYYGGHLHCLPSGPLSMIRRSSLLGESLALRLLREVYIEPEMKDDDTIYNFMERRFEKKVTELLIDPFIRGIYAGDCRTLSMRSCLPDLFEYEQMYGSVVKGVARTKAAPMPTSDLVRRSRTERWSVWSLREGLGMLPKRLASYLSAREDVELLTNTPCTGVTFNADKTVTVRMDSGEITVDHLVAATNSKDLSALLPAHMTSLSTMLSEIDYVTVGVVNLEYPGHVIKQPGFGHLIPSCEPSKNLGIVYDSCTFPQHDAEGEATTRLTVMLGGAWFEQLFGSPACVSRNVLEDAAVSAARQQLDIAHLEPRNAFVTVQRDCIPQYRLGHHRLLEQFRSEIAEKNLPLDLIGASYQGVSINDCIHEAKRTANRITSLISR